MDTIHYVHAGRPATWSVYQDGTSHPKLLGTVRCTPDGGTQWYAYDTAEKRQGAALVFTDRDDAAQHLASIARRPRS